MNKKSKKAQRKQIIEQNPPLYLSEGHWEEAMLENDSYYDIEMLHKHNKPILKRIEKLTKEQDKAVNWLGKWWWQIKIDREREKLKHYENKP